EPGVEGLLHTSQIARANVESPHDVLKEGETHLLRIISINSDRQRMGLSLKAVTATEQIEWMTQREQDVAAEESDSTASSEDVEEIEIISEQSETATEDQEAAATADEQAPQDELATVVEDGAVEAVTNEIDESAAEAAASSEVEPAAT
ncbi:MAG TPA: S1 RNA-binding domain-containing protein, partial [Candidatus Binatia bacterium]|nr:S1 RNA-binding domain-containing protein [Candidatus Binatia bacterium]